MTFCDWRSQSFPEELGTTFPVSSPTWRGLKKQGSDTSLCYPFLQIEEIHGKLEKPAPLLFFISLLNSCISYENMTNDRHYRDAESRIHSNDNWSALENPKECCVSEVGIQMLQFRLINVDGNHPSVSCHRHWFL
ncbi:hypothetical protein AV530_013409 [Patagioenas fasciata monilis]|uniref:Uncharacterized protein n=1 Tax=Patagioenas fasciata monilis TaxID=372326 RepID=A0A1V4JPA3_PATFA|nr:hypothetical protein AV530_013409 [Patagioenas fasciata monilis]